MSGISSATAMLIAGGSSSVLSGVSKYEQGQQQQQAYDYNADVTKINSNSQVVAESQRFTQLAGKQASTYAASGVDIASGSPLLIMAATAARGGQQGEQIQQAGDEQSEMQRYYGAKAAFNGTENGIGAFLNGMTGDLTATGKLNNNPSPSAPTFSPGSFGLVAD